MIERRRRGRLAGETAHRASRRGREAASTRRCSRAADSPERSRISIIASRSRRRETSRSASAASPHRLPRTATSRSSDASTTRTRSRPVGNRSTRAYRCSSIATSPSRSCAPTQTDDVYFANGDGDELWFVHEGAARLESPCGWLDVVAGDYVWVPQVDDPSLARATTELRAMIFEAPDGIVIPKEFRNPGRPAQNGCTLHASRFRAVPEGPLAQDGPRELLVKKGGTFTHYALAHPPMDVVGWDGFVYPWAFAIEKYQPKTGLVHLPPTIHTTFAARGFLVCSFVPRVVDTHPQAIPCPYPHSSVDCDEIILYLRGNFTIASRRRARMHLASSGRHRARSASGRVRSEHRREAHRRARRHVRHVFAARRDESRPRDRSRRLSRELDVKVSASRSAS